MLASMSTLELLKLCQTLVHYGLHLLAPGLIAWLFYRTQWRQAWAVLLVTMLVDLDHLLAYPDVFVPERCGIGFHPLHSTWAIAAYALMTFSGRTRLVGIGLLLHMLTDAQDCVWIACLG